MVKYIQLTTTPFGYPIFFETTGIKVEAISRDEKGHAMVNGISVKEKFNEIIYILQSE